MRLLNNANRGPWFHIRDGSATTPCQITIDQEIGCSGVSAQVLAQQIKMVGEDVRISLHIYSAGGDLLDGNEIANALRDHKGGVDVTIGALCASIATVIACAGKTVSMAQNGLYMIHNPTTFADGEAEDFRRLADVMDKMKGGIVAAYVSKTGLKEADLGAMMSATTWMTAEEALAKGFIDKILPMDADNEDIENRFGDLARVKNFAAAISRVKRNPAVSAAASGQGNLPKEKPENRETQTTSTQSLADRYKMKQIRIFNSATPRIFNNGAPAPTGPIAGESIANEAEVKKQARELYTAKLARDKEIRDMVVAVRTRDKKDFSELAEECMVKDMSVDEFARILVTSDKFKPHEVVGSGIEVIGERGLTVGTPGELFVASDEYKAIVDRVRKGSRTHASAIVQTKGFIAEAMQRFLNATTSTGLTSIEKLGGVVTLGVRPLMVKDLIAPGATNNTTIRYIQEQTFTNAATTVAEGATKPAASFSLQEIDAPVKKIAAYTKVTDELFADYLAVASYINMRLPYMVERTVEDQLLNGDGTGTNLTGILSTAGIQTQAKAADTAPDALYKAITKVRWGNLAGTAQGGFEPDAYVMHPTDWEGLRLLKDAANQYLAGGPFTGAYGNGQMVQFEMIWGKPVVITPAIAQGTALLGAFRLASQYFQRQGLTIESTNTDQDDFIKNLTTIRAEERLALAVYRPLAFCQVTGL